MIKLKFILVFALTSSLTSFAFAKPQSFKLLSPNNKLETTVDVSDQISYSVKAGAELLVSPSAIALKLENETLGIEPKLMKQFTKTVSSNIPSPFYKRSSVKEDYNELRLTFKGDYAVVFRAYDSGIAYHFETTKKGDIKVVGEKAEFNMAGDPVAWYFQSNNFHSAYEDLYKDTVLSKVTSDREINLPLVLVYPSWKVTILEADVYDYPGMFLQKNDKGLSGINPQVPKSVVPGGYNNYVRIVDEREDYIAQTKGTRTFPWRAISIVKEDRQLLDNDLVFLLSSPASGDFSWVKPGQVFFDWWPAMRLTRVDFKSGINTDTYKYYIDCAARNGIEYVNIDEGWSASYDLMDITKEMDMPFLVDYAKKKGVGLFLWAASSTLEKQMEEVFDLAVDWGVKGFKVDFFLREDQPMINLYERIASEAAKRKLMVNFHGAKKPTGLSRKYPNVVNQEAVRGIEHNKFDTSGIGAPSGQAIIIPFTRMQAGFMDYTPGGMTNANRKDFRIIWDRPMTEGTRMQQIASYVIYHMPLAMLSDSPTEYEKEPEILDLLSSIPTVWDECIPVDGKIGEYAVMAKRKGTNWFVAGMNSPVERELELDLSFLPAKAKGVLWKDGMNAALIGNDYQKENIQLAENGKLKVKMEPGGGFLMRIE